MSGLKLSELPENTSPLTTDKLIIIDDPGVTPASQNITIANLLTLFVSNVVIQTKTASGTYTPTSGMKKCLVIAVGGGGGGAGGINTDASGGGGGGGGTAIKLLDASAIGASKAFTIGAAGTGETSLGNHTNGGDTYLGASGSELVKATGGTKGTTGPAWSAAYVYAAGGAGGIGTVGDLLIAGTPGGMGITWSGSMGWGGEGGCSFLGGSGLQGAQNTAGTVGGSYGAGGGGGHATSGTNKNGANGVIGVIYIIEFLG